MVFDLAFVAREKIIADLDPAGRGVRGRLVNDGADAAKIDIAIIGDQLDRRRCRVDREVLFQDGLVAAEEMPQRGVACSYAQYRGSFLDGAEFR